MELETNLISIDFDLTKLRRNKIKTGDKSYNCRQRTP